MITPTFTLLAEEFAAERIRRRRAEQRLRELESMLGALGITLWQTDGELRLTGSFGLLLADAYLNCPIGDFCRDVYGLDPAESEPALAHRDARSGRRVVLSFEHDQHRLAILVEPKRDSAGAIEGTVGMALDLAPPSSGTSD